MHFFYRPDLARRCLGTAGLLLACCASAQVAPNVQPAATALQADPAAARPGNRPDQKIERIRTEDAGTRIDELRVGGQTQSITVQPKNDMPAYDIKPADPQGGSHMGTTGTTGNRVWNFLKF